MKPKKHALVVGGTGMLSDVVLWLIDEGYHVSVIGRNENKQNVLKKMASNSNQYTKMVVDYRQSGLLLSEIQKVITENGPIQLVVSWIHSTAPDALASISTEINSLDKKWKLFDIQGSSKYLKGVANDTYSRCSYRRVGLGFVLGNKTSRWLTHKEIATGIIECIKNDKADTVIGTITPWEQRP